MNPLSESGVYLSTLPSSWGSAYFADRWLEFSTFAQTRLMSEYWNAANDTSPQDLPDGSGSVLDVPGAHSNVWTKSWKRFMVDFMYARALWMLYPNLPRQRGLASTIGSCGTHIPNGNITGAECDSNSTTIGRLKDFHNTRVSWVLQPKDAGDLQQVKLPDYFELPLFDIFLQPTTRVYAAEQGNALLSKVAEHHPNLAKEWKRPGWIGYSRVCTPDLFPSVVIASQVWATTKLCRLTRCAC